MRRLKGKLDNREPPAYIYTPGLTKKDGGDLSAVSCSSSMESLLSSADQSPAVSAPASPISSPVTARRVIKEIGEPSQSPSSPGLVAIRAAKLNLLESKLKEEFKGTSRMLT